MNIKSKSYLLLFGIILFVSILLFGDSYYHLIGAGDTEKKIEDLRLIVGIFKEEDAGFFNEVLNENDAVFTWGAKTRLLEKIKGPKILVSVQTISDMEMTFEQLKNRNINIDYMNYNPETWGVKRGKSKQEEIEVLPSAVKRARDLAHKKGVKLAFGTDYILLKKHGEEIAPMVDLFGIQLQRYQKEPLKKFREEALKKVAIVRKGSKKVPIVIQVSMAPPEWEVYTRPNGEKIKVPVRTKDGKKIRSPLKAEVVLEQIETIKDLTEWIAFLYTEETKEEMKKLIRLIRK